MSVSIETHQNNRVNIIIADDHSIFRDGLKTVLKKIQSVKKISEAGNGKETIALLEKNSFDIVLMDIEMPEMDGVEATKIIRSRFPQVKVIALTMFNNQKYILELYDAGVDGYLLKNTTLDELSKAIDTVSGGEHFYSKEISDVLYKGLLKRDTISAQKSELEHITPREIEIMKLVCDQFTNFEIAEKLFISRKTVERHKENLFAKTHSKNLAGLVVFAIKHDMYRINRE